MITECARIEITAGREDDFAEVFETAKAFVNSFPGSHGARLLRGIESPSTFLLLVEWETLEAHTEGFRSSPNFTCRREHVGEFFAQPPDVEHFRLL